jgi:hypothetical protein
VSLFSPVVDLSGRSSVILTFWHRYDLEQGFDFANVWVTTDGGATYVGPLAQFTGTSTVWTSATVDVSPFAGQPTVQIAFQVFSNSSITRDGWYIDDVVVAEVTLAVGVFRPSSGQWFLDLNGNGQWDGCGVERCGNFGLPGDIPVVGDWTGTGTTKIGIFRNGQWFLDLNGNGQWDGCGVERCGNFGLPGDMPVVGARFGPR